MAEVNIVLKGIDEFSGVLDSAAGGLARLGDVAGKLAAVGLAAAAAGATALAGGLAFSIAQALEGEKILTRLDTVIRSTGGAAGLTTEAAQDLATQFMNLAGGTDDTVLAIEEMALRMAAHGHRHCRADARLHPDHAGPGRGHGGGRGQCRAAAGPGAGRPD
jgi:hypothetical protein